jgi:outer membrane autotransporter protein
MAAVSPFAGNEALAACSTGGTISSSSTTCQTLSGGGSLTVGSTGSLSVSSSSDAVTVTSQTTGVTITNSGTIADTASGKRAITINGTSQTSLVITNNAGATITSSGDDAIHGGKNSAQITSGSLIINNDGTISATGSSGQAIDLDNTSGTFTSIINNNATGVISSASSDAIKAGVGATINNAGTITGAKHGITGSSGITVDNSGTITGNGGSGINMDTTDEVTTVINRASGVITGTADGTSDGDGIDVDYTVDIKNYGTITAVGTTSGELNEAISVGGGLIYNYSGGVISSVQQAITVKGDDASDGTQTSAYSAVTLYNEGTITAASGYYALYIVGGNNYADTVTNKGTITGNILTADGDDVFNLYTGSSIDGTIDGGTGSDTINLYGTGSGTLGSVTNVENLNVASGSWTLAGGQSYSGTVTLASGTSATVSGSFTFASGSTYVVTLGSSTGLLAVNGALTIASGSTVSALGSASIGRYTIATYNSLSGSFSSITDNSSQYDYTLSYDNNAVTLIVSRDSSISAANFATTSNQAGAANAVNSLGSSNAVYAAIAQTPDSGVPNALNQVSGDSFTGVSGSIASSIDFASSLPMDRLDASVDAGFSPLGFAEEKRPSKTERKYFAAVMPKKDERRASAQTSRQVWARVFGTMGRNWSGNAGVQTSSLGGVMFGADTPVDLGEVNWRAGLAGSYGYSATKNDSRNASTMINNYFLVAYGGGEVGSFVVKAGLGGGISEIRSNRLVSLTGLSQTLTASYGAQSVIGFGEAGYKVKTGGLEFEPFAGLTGSYTHVNGFTESGGTAALTSAAANINTAFTKVGARATASIDDLKLTGSLAWRHGFGDLSPSSRLAFASGGSSYTVSGLAQARDAAVIGAGASYRFTDTATGSLDYDGTLSAKSWEHSLKATLKVQF